MSATSAPTVPAIVEVIAPQKLSVYTEPVTILVHCNVHAEGRVLSKGPVAGSPNAFLHPAPIGIGCVLHDGLQVSTNQVHVVRVLTGRQQVKSGGNRSGRNNQEQIACTEQRINAARRNEKLYSEAKLKEKQQVKRYNQGSQVHIGIW